jgi:hypothetical protein
LPEVPYASGFPTVPYCISRLRQCMTRVPSSYGIFGRKSESCYNTIHYHEFLTIWCTGNFCKFIFPTSKYSPQHLAFESPRPVFRL